MPVSIGVGVTVDGRLLVHEPNSRVLHLVAPSDLQPVELELPRAVEAVVTGRAHDSGIWMVAFDPPQTLFRWYLVDEMIVEEGQYGDSGLGNEFIDYYGGVMDANGDFFHIAQGADDLIVRRGLAPVVGEIVYKESELPETAVHIHISELFTGP